MTPLLRFIVPALLIFLTAHAQVQDPVPTLTKGTKKLPLPGEAFQLNGRDAFVILPKDAGKNVPWVWYAPTLRGLPAKAEIWMFERFLAAGVAIAGIDVGESYGSPEGRKAFSQLYQHLTGTRNC